MELALKMMTYDQSKSQLCATTLFWDQSYQFDKLIEKQLCPMIHEGNVKILRMSQIV